MKEEPVHVPGVRRITGAAWRFPRSIGGWVADCSCGRSEPGAKLTERGARRVSRRHAKLSAPRPIELAREGRTFVLRLNVGDASYRLDQLYAQVTKTKAELDRALAAGEVVGRELAEARSNLEAHHLKHGGDRCMVCAVRAKGAKDALDLVAPEPEPAVPHPAAPARTWVQATDV